MPVRRTINEGQPVQLTTIHPDTADAEYLEFGFGPGGKPLPGDPRALLSTLAAGDMRYLPGGANERRIAFFKARGIDPDRALSLQLRHTRRVVVHASGGDFRTLADAADAQGGADGIATSDKSAVPALTVADCMPIWLHDEKIGAFGVLHSGWKGTGILAEALRSMASAFGTVPDDVSVILGPSIGPCCYTVPEERAAAFRAEFGDAAVLAEPGAEIATSSAASAAASSPRFRLDLRAANLALAERLGVGRVLNVDLCTSCTTALGSYRRQGPERFTRMLALCGYF
jgi:YfiH family protein